MSEFWELRNKINQLASENERLQEEIKRLRENETKTQRQINLLDQSIRNRQNEENERLSRQLRRKDCYPDRN